MITYADLGEYWSGREAGDRARMGRALRHLLRHIPEADRPRAVRLIDMNADWSAACERLRPKPRTQLRDDAWRAIHIRQAHIRGELWDLCDMNSRGWRVEPDRYL